MQIVRIVDALPNGQEHIEWVQWTSRTQDVTLEGREAEIAEEAYQQGLQDSGDE